MKLTIGEIESIGNHRFYQKMKWKLLLVGAIIATLFILGIVMMDTDTNYQRTYENTIDSTDQIQTEIYGKYLEIDGKLYERVVVEKPTNPYFVVFELSAVALLLWGCYKMMRGELAAREQIRKEYGVWDKEIKLVKDKE